MHDYLTTPEPHNEIVVADNSMQSPVLKFNDYQALTLEQCFEGIAVTGSSGSGKSTGSGRALARSFMRAGFGGLVLCAKPDEVKIWRQYAVDFNRKDDLLVLDGKNNNRFNFWNMS